MAKRQRSMSVDGTEATAQDTPIKAAKAETTPAITLRCTWPPTCSFRASIFHSQAELESHHASHHSHVCTDQSCQRIFPSDAFLQLHIDEIHNPLIAIQRDERGMKTFKCFEFQNGCKKKFSTPKKRRLHLIDKHQYPDAFYFSLPAKGLNDLYEQYGAGASLVRPQWKPRPGQPGHVEDLMDIGENRSSSPNSSATGSKSPMAMDSVPQKSKHTRFGGD